MQNTIEIDEFTVTLYGYRHNRWIRILDESLDNSTFYTAVLDTLTLDDITDIEATFSYHHDGLITRGYSLSSKYQNYWVHHENGLDPNLHHLYKLVDTILELIDTLGLEDHPSKNEHSSRLFDDDEE